MKNIRDLTADIQPLRRGTLLLLIAIAGAFYLSLRPSYGDDLVPREKLSAVINSEYQEVRPLISADGLTLYFSRRYHPENQGGIRDYQDIWVSRFIDGSWSMPTNLGKPINNKKANTLCSVTHDGRLAILLNSYKRVKTPLAQASNSLKGWQNPKQLVIADFVNESPFYDFYYHEQSEVLLMAIDNGRGAGEQDLYVSFKQTDGSYSSPINLGKEINTRKSDFAPFLAADGRTLYFASYGHRGFGGSDLYVAYRVDDSWKRWTKPKNLGTGINSKHDENYLSVTGDFSYIYFESYPAGSQEKDLYRAPLPRQFQPQFLAPESDTEVEDLIASETPSLDSPISIDSARERSREQLKSAASQVEPAYWGTLATRQYLQEGQLHAKVLSNAYFSYDSYQLSAKSKSKLLEIAEILNRNSSMEAELEGHSDSWGHSSVNLRISYLRALAAAHFLIDQGISNRRLLVTGTGEGQPLASNDDEIEGRELNRRVEITLINSAGVYQQFTIR